MPVPDQFHICDCGQHRSKLWMATVVAETEQAGLIRDQKNDETSNRTSQSVDWSLHQSDEL